ncbi:MAG: hypothetical protein AMJ94_17480 [Deltaproteobacteria bacterium SM23_61]|nr:MAG: hypothetical protein AMJ94_17480 [Deltaproteobacteria bacterium SM23_61]
MNNGEEFNPRADLNWDDEGVLPPVLSPDTEYVFRRMTEETLKAAGAANSSRILDVGCGRGIDAAALARKGDVLFGCEASRIMLQKAREGLRKSGETVRLVGSLAETLPFAGQSFHRVVCKGAIDHFFSPERAVDEMGRVACAGGKVIISVANFESLSCFLSRTLNRFVCRIWKRDLPSPHIWEIPKDHTHKFDYPSTLGLAGKYLRVESVRGVSLLWGFPRWSNFLRRLPRPLALILLSSLDKIATGLPDWSDVLILVGRPKNQFPRKERSS